MKPITTLLIATALLASCGHYTEATSPCFGQGNTPDVSRAAQIPLSIVEPTTPATKDCDFQPLAGPNG